MPSWRLTDIVRSLGQKFGGRDKGPAMHAAVAGFSLESRQQVTSWLRGTNDVLAEVCDSMFALIYGPPVPGRAMLMAHCVRELRNALVAHFVGIGGPRLEYRDEVELVAVEWDRAALALPSAVPPSTTIPASTTAAIHLPVPLSLAVALRGLVDKHRLVTLTNRERTEQLFATLQLGTGADGRVFRRNVDNWHDLVEWFVGKVHVRTRTDHDLLDDEYYERMGSFLESLRTFARAPAFVEGLEEIDAILAEANRSAS